jgi:hypothetical protein
MNEENKDIVLITSLKCGDMIEFVCDDLQDDFVKQPCYIHDYRPTTKELVFSSTYIIKTATVLGIKIHQPTWWVGDSAPPSTILILLFTDIGTFNSYMSRDTNLTATVKLIKSYEQL